MQIYGIKNVTYTLNERSRMEPDVYAVMTCSLEVPDRAGRVRGYDALT